MLVVFGCAEAVAQSEPVLWCGSIGLKVAFFECRGANSGMIERLPVVGVVVETYGMKAFLGLPLKCTLVIHKINIFA
jgi:hypothetical protein